MRTIVISGNRLSGVLYLSDVQKKSQQVHTNTVPQRVRDRGSALDLVKNNVHSWFSEVERKMHVQLRRTAFKSRNRACCPVSRHISNSCVDIYENNSHLKGIFNRSALFFEVPLQVFIGCLW